MAEEQKSIAKNEAIHTIFFEDNWLAYNYKTDQWSRLPSFAGYKPFSIYGSSDVIATIIESEAFYAYQGQSGGTAQDATIETGETDINEGGRASVIGVRPIVRGGTVSAKVGIRNSFNDSVTYSTGTSINSRTGMANFRAAENRAEGRFQRVKLDITGGFTTAIGVDVEHVPSGRA